MVANLFSLQCVNKEISLRGVDHHIDGLVRETRNSSMLAME